jgi:hypothetical protein
MPKAALVFLMDFDTALAGIIQRIPWRLWPGATNLKGNSTGAILVKFWVHPSPQTMEGHANAGEDSYLPRRDPRVLALTDLPETGLISS